MEAVDILGGQDALGDGGLLDLLGQWQLHQDAVDRWVGVEPIDEIEERCLTDHVGQLVQLRIDADLGAGAALVANIDPRGRIRTDQHHREPWHASARGADGLDLVGDRCEDLGCGGLPV